MTLTVIIVYSGRQRLFEKCLSSVLVALPNGAKVKVVLNGDYPEIRSRLSSTVQPVEVLSLTKTSRCVARNIAIAETHSELVYFLDDDVEVPSHLFLSAVEEFSKDPDLAVLGGPNLTPPSSSFKEKVFGAVVTSPVCAPKVYQRYRRSHSTKVQAADQHDLILCNFVVRRSLVWPKLKFVPHVTSNEENIFVFQAKELGLKVAKLASLYVFHCRRKTLFSFLQQIRSYGFGRGEQMVLEQRSTHYLFYLGLSLPWIAGGILLFFPVFTLPIISTYFTLSLLGALASREVRQLGVVGVWLVALLTPVVQVTYFSALGLRLIHHGFSKVLPKVQSPVPSPV
jgi:glycosyltransferase involved in cell wall biosynthesis